MTKFSGKVIQTDEYDKKINYPHEMQISDSEELIASQRRPLILNYYEIKDLYDLIKPIVELWENHNRKIHDQLQHSEISEKEAMKQIKWQLDEKK